MLDLGYLDQSVCLQDHFQAMAVWWPLGPRGAVTAGDESLPEAACMRHVRGEALGLRPVSRSTAC